MRFERSARMEALFDKDGGRVVTQVMGEGLLVFDGGFDNGADRLDVIDLIPHLQAWIATGSLELPKPPEIFAEPASLFVKGSCNCWECLDAREAERRAAGDDRFFAPFFNVCPKCGNKRCPHCSDHRFRCTNSNEPGQKGSVYE